MNTLKRKRVEMSGQLGNYLMRNKSFCLNHTKGQTEEKWNEEQKKIDLECDLMSEYLTDKILKDENFQLLDIDLERFVSDTDYYYEVFDNKKEMYDMIIRWFSKEVIEYWNDLIKMVTQRGISDRIVNLQITIFDKYIDGIGLSLNDNETDMEKIMEVFRSYMTSHYLETSVRKSINRKDKIGWNTDEDDILNTLLEKMEMN